jgi:hypothetical protein
LVLELSIVPVVDRAVDARTTAEKAFRNLARRFPVGVKQEDVEGQKISISAAPKLSVWAEQDEVSCFPNKLQAQSAFDQIAIDSGRPIPVEVGHWPESADPGLAQQAL